jgi:hypothetical protein
MRSSVLQGQSTGHVRIALRGAILPVNAGPHGFGGLAVREVFAKLQDGDERQEPGRERRLAARREERGKILVAVEGAQLVPK